jgi:hypothetical protein
VYADLPLGGLDGLGLREDAPEAHEFLLGVARAVYDVTPFAATGIGHEIQGPHVIDYLEGQWSTSAASARYFVTSSRP